MKSGSSRKSTRLANYDYSEPGYYFITLCSINNRPIFGNIDNDFIVLNEYGQIVKETWLDIPNHNSNIQLDYFIIMPDHFHGIIIIEDFSNKSVEAGSKPARSLTEVVRQLKTFSSKKINKLRNMPGTRVWQSSFYDRIIRSDQELHEVRKYIKYNHLKKRV